MAEPYEGEPRQVRYSQKFKDWEVYIPNGHMHEGEWVPAFEEMPDLAHELLAFDAVRIDASGAVDRKYINGGWEMEGAEITYEAQERLSLDPHRIGLGPDRPEYADIVANLEALSDYGHEDFEPIAAARRSRLDGSDETTPRYGSSGSYIPKPRIYNEEAEGQPWPPMIVYTPKELYEFEAYGYTPPPEIDKGAVEWWQAQQKEADLQEAGFVKGPEKTGTWFRRNPDGALTQISLPPATEEESLSQDPFGTAQEALDYAQEQGLPIESPGDLRIPDYLTAGGLGRQPGTFYPSPVPGGRGWTLPQVPQRKAEAGFVEGPQGTWFRSNPDGTLTQVSLPEDDEPTSLDGLATKQFLAGDVPGAQATLDFLNQPTSEELFDRALALARSPGDQLTLYAMRQGQIEPFKTQRGDFEILGREAPDPKQMFTPRTQITDLMPQGFGQGRQAQADITDEELETVQGLSNPSVWPYDYDAGPAMRRLNELRESREAVVPWSQPFKDKINRMFTVPQGVSPTGTGGQYSLSRDKMLELARGRNVQDPIQWPQLQNLAGFSGGPIGFRSESTKRQQGPVGRELFRTAVEHRGIPLQSFLEEEKRATGLSTPTLPKRIRYA